MRLRKPIVVNVNFRALRSIMEIVRLVNCNNANR